MSIHPQEVQTSGEMNVLNTMNMQKKKNNMIWKDYVKFVN